MTWDGASDYYLEFKDPSYLAMTTSNLDFDTDILRYGYQSLTTPSSVIDFDMVTKTKTIKKEQEVLGGKFKKLMACGNRSNKIVPTTGPNCDPIPPTTTMVRSMADCKISN